MLVSPLTEGRRFPGGVLCPLCPHIHIPNGIMPEGPTVVRLPWGECHPEEAPQLLSTQCKWPRPDLCSNPLSCGSLAYMAYTGELGLWAVQTQGSYFTFPLLSPFSILALRQNFSQRRTLCCPCSGVILPFLPSFHPSSAQRKSSRNSSFPPALGL